MTVIVHMDRNSNLGPETLRFDGVSTWSIDHDGYLYIIAAGQTQAVVAPGRWVCVRKARGEA